MDNRVLFRDHFETQVEIGEPPAEVFELLDNHRRLFADMTPSSSMMARSRRMLGLSPVVEEVEVFFSRFKTENHSLLLDAQTLIDLASLATAHR